MNLDIETSATSITYFKQFQDVIALSWMKLLAGMHALHNGYAHSHFQQGADVHMPQGHTQALE
jgi:hypothetical protein